MERKLEWLVMRALEAMHVALLLAALTALALALAGCAASLSSRDGELLRVEVERKPSDLKLSSGPTSASVLPLVSDR